MGIEQFPRLSAWGMLTNMIKRGIAIFPYNGVPTATTYAGKAGPGSLVVNYNTGVYYVNLGTKAAPIWGALGGTVAAGTGGSTGGGLGAVGNAKMTYDFATDGGAIATITPTNSPTLPAGAIVLGGVIDITTTLTSGGLATIALGFGSGAQVAALKGATAVASYAAGTTLVMIPIFTSATYYKLTAAARMTLTVAAFVLTAGRLDVNVVYVQGNV